MKDQACAYILWNYYKAPTVECNPPGIISEIAERIFRFPQHNYLLLNINEHIKACRDVLLVFKDAVHRIDLPTEFARIPFVTDKDELELWLATHHIQGFSLMNRSRFVKTNLPRQQGKAVYKEIETNHYWYMDNFHKNEYEVFDSNGKHIGVANLQGVVDMSQSRKDRAISL